MVDFIYSENDRPMCLLMRNSLKVPEVMVAVAMNCCIVYLHISWEIDISFNAV